MQDARLSPGVTYVRNESDLAKQFMDGHPKGFVKLQPYNQAKNQLNQAHTYGIYRTYFVKAIIFYARRSSP